MEINCNTKPQLDMWDFTNGLIQDNLVRCNVTSQTVLTAMPVDLLAVAIGPPVTAVMRTATE